MKLYISVGAEGTGLGARAVPLASSSTTHLRGEAITALNRLEESRPCVFSTPIHFEVGFAQRLATDRPAMFPRTALREERRVACEALTYPTAMYTMRPRDGLTGPR